MPTTPPRKVAIVTGASSGIGRAACLLLADEGFDLALVSRRQAELEATAGAIRSRAPQTRCLVLPVDLTDPQATQAAVHRTADHFGRIDALVNSAGAAPNLPVEGITPVIWRECIDTNLSYVVTMTAAIWPIFRTQGGGIIVNLSSLAAFDPFNGFAAYAASKAGVNMFTFATAREGAELGIRVVAVAPGCVETPMLRRNFGTDAVPPERTLAPQDVAKLIVDCIQGRREFGAGQTLLVPSP